MRDPIDVLVVDDEQMWRDGLRELLAKEPSLRVVGVASGGAEAVNLAADLAPHVVLMDIKMPGMDGIQATERMKREISHPPRVIVLTAFENENHNVFRALMAGAYDFAAKHVEIPDLVRKIRNVASSDAPRIPDDVLDLTRKFYAEREREEQIAATTSSFTPTERKVLRLLAKGHTNAEIAKELFIGHQTVKNHMGTIFSKLGIYDRTKATVWALDSGFLQLLDEE